MEMMESINNNTLEKGGEYQQRQPLMGNRGRLNLTPSNLAAFNQNHNFADLLQNPLSDDRCSITNHPLVQALRGAHGINGA